MSGQVKSASECDVALKKSNSPPGQLCKLLKYSRLASSHEPFYCSDLYYTLESNEFKERKNCRDPAREV